MRPPSLPRTAAAPDDPANDVDVVPPAVVVASHPLHASRIAR